MASNNNNSLPIPSTSIMLMEEFRGLEIYASCAIAIYFYELISCSFKVVKWYKSRLWTIPEVVLEFDGIDVNKQDGNCYLSNATVGAQSLSIGFVMLMIYCWVIWTSAIYAMYSTSNSPNFGKSRYWRRILFDNGLMYISLIALSQAMNVIIMFDGKSYLGKFINVTPLLVLTSICVQKSLVNTKSFNDRERTHLPFFRPFSSTNVKNINDRSINIKNIDDGSTQYQHHESFTTFQPYPQDQVRMPSPTLSSFTSSTKVDSVPPSLPPIIIHKSAKYDTSNSGYDEYNEKPQSPDGQRITQDFGSSLMFYLNAITRESNQHGIKLQNNKDRRRLANKDLAKKQEKVNKFLFYNESLTFPIHYPSFGFSATIIADDDDEHIFDHKKVVRASEVQGKFLKKYEDRESSLQD
ncbi:20695_t:CDS:2 [Funneliformis geosporum]|nr:20695_t:CDS:2 [Funneliformis geosporum]